MRSSVLHTHTLHTILLDNAGTAALLHVQHACAYDTSWRCCLYGAMGFSMELCNTAGQLHSRNTSVAERQQLCLCHTTAQNSQQLHIKLPSTPCPAHKLPRAAQLSTANLRNPVRYSHHLTTDNSQHHPAHYSNSTHTTATTGQGQSYHQPNTLHRQKAL